MKKVLLLGSNGQLGYDISQLLSQQNDLNFVQITRVDFDVEQDNIDKLNQYNKFDYIINCTAYTHVDQCEDLPNKAFQINAIFVYQLAHFCQQNKITLFHFSTDYVFDGKKDTPYTEKDQPNPINMYGLSKYAGELAIQNYCEKYFIFRVSSLFGVHGVSGTGNNFIETMLKMAQEKKDIKVVDDQFMSPTYTLDVAQMVQYFITNSISQYGIFHCCNTGSCSWFEFTSKIFELSNVNYPIKRAKYSDYVRKATRPRASCLNNKKLNAINSQNKWSISLTQYLNQRAL